MPMHQYSISGINVHIEPLCIAIHRCITVLLHLYSYVVFSSIAYIDIKAVSCLLKIATLYTHHDQWGHTPE